MHTDEVEYALYPLYR